MNSLFRNSGYPKIFFSLIILAIVFSVSFKIKAQTKVSAKTNNSAKSKEIVLTQKDREIALEYLTETKEKFIKEISGLSDAQINFRKDKKSWSVMEISEHIVLAENLIYSLVTKRFLKAPVPIGKNNYRTKDRAVWLMITNRSTKYNAPEKIQPKGKFKAKAEIITGFKEARAKTMSYIKNTKADLRNFFGENPGIGMIDAYQWFIFLDGHTYRHLEQIREIKGHPDFPK